MVADPDRPRADPTAAARVLADLGWRHDQLRARRRQRVTSVLLPVTTLASLLLAAYYVAFSVYLLGGTGLADHRVWGRFPLQGFAGYEDQAGAVAVFGGAGLVLAIAAVARPIAPVVANVVTLQIAVMSVAFFWLGVSAARSDRRRRCRR